MQITIDLPTNANGELIIPVRKTESDYAIRLADVNPDNLARLFMYGVTQVTNDCHASVKETEHVQAAIDKRWDAIYSGDWRVRAAGSGESANPVEREALAMAREATRAAYATARKENTKLPKWGDIDEAKRDGAARAFFDKNRDALMAKAKARLDEKRDAATGIDLTDLGL
jgi:hypothetical protein